MTTACPNVQIKYKGNGTQQVYSFPFTYISWQDVEAFLYDEQTKEWVNQQNKFVQETATSLKFLTAPPASSTPNILISRNTEVSSMVATYYPGSSIRAQDLNDDFDQLRMAVQEGRCDWENLKNDDTFFVKTEDLVGYTDQTTGVWGPATNREFGVPTTAGAAARFDSYVQPNLPATVPYQQPGKNWENTNDCWTSYWNPEAQAWVAYVNTGPRGLTGPDGGPGPAGPQGPRGDGVVVSGYIDVPGPPASDGTISNELIIDSNGIGWIWDTDGNSDQWINIGSIQGPPGPPGVAANVNVGITTTGAAGSNAEVVNVGSSASALLNFTIPQGAAGPSGPPGASGTGILDSITGNTPIFVDQSDAANPIIYLNFSQLTKLPA